MTQGLRLPPSSLYVLFRSRGGSPVTGPVTSDGEWPGERAHLLFPFFSRLRRRRRPRPPAADWNVLTVPFRVQGASRNWRRLQHSVLRNVGNEAAQRGEQSGATWGAKGPPQNKSIAPRALMRPGRKARGCTPTAGVLAVRRGRWGPRNAADRDAVALECTSYSAAAQRRSGDRAGRWSVARPFRQVSQRGTVMTSSEEAGAQ